MESRNPTGTPPAAFVSVIIPHFNDWERLQGCLEHLGKQRYPRDRFEILVVDNGSDADRSRDMPRLSNLRFLVEPRKGSYAARNRALEAARGACFAFTDSDCLPAETWLQNGVQALEENPGAGFVGGEIQAQFALPAVPNPWELYDARTHLNQRENIKTKHFAATANMFTTRAVMDSCGRFDQDRLSGGDQAWGRRVTAKGHNAVFDDRVVVRHPARGSFGALHRKACRIVGGQQVTLRTLSAGRRATVWLSAMLPPVLEVYRKAIIGPDLRVSQRVSLAAVATLMKYVRLLEKLRLLCGASPRR